MKKLTACERNLAFQFFIYMMQQTFGAVAHWPPPTEEEKREIVSGKFYL